MHIPRATAILVLALVAAPGAAEVTRKGEGCLCPGMTKIARVPAGTDCSAFCGSPKKRDDEGSGSRAKASCESLAAKSGLSSFYHPDSVVRQFLAMHPECASSIPWRDSTAYVPSTSDEALVHAGAAVIDSIFDAIGQAQANRRLRKQREAQAAAVRAREAGERRSADFDREKRETLSMMKGPSSALSLKSLGDTEDARLRDLSGGVRAQVGSLFDSLGIASGGLRDTAESPGCDDAGCLAGCPIVAGPMGSREVDAACVRRCASCAGDDAVPSPVLATGGESDYFYDLQMRESMPGLTRPLPDLGSLESRWSDSWRLASPEVSVDRSVIDRLEEARHQAADRTIEWAREEAVDHVLDKIPGASTLKSTYETMLPIADSVITSAFDRLNEAPAVLAFGEGPDLDAASARASKEQEAVAGSIEAAAHGALLDSVAARVWKDQLREGLKGEISERWGFVLGLESEGTDYDDFNESSIWSIPDHPDAFRWRAAPRRP